MNLEVRNERNSRNFKKVAKKSLAVLTLAGTIFTTQVALTPQKAEAARSKASATYTDKDIKKSAKFYKEAKIKDALEKSFKAGQKAYKYEKDAMKHYKNCIKYAEKIKKYARNGKSDLESALGDAITLAASTEIKSSIVKRAAIIYSLYNIILKEKSALSNAAGANAYMKLLKQEKEMYFECMSKAELQREISKKYEQEYRNLKYPPGSENRRVK